MKASTSLFVLLLASQVLPWASQCAHAQTAHPMTPQREDESDGQRMRIDYSIAYSNAYRKTPAYSAEEVTEKNKTLADGNQIKNRQSRMRYQDRDGRVRTDYKSYDGNERIFIADPKAKVAYLIRPDRKDILRIQGEPSMPRLSADYARIPTRAPAWNKEVTTSLGLKDFTGVTAAGTLTETFYPAGADGNEKERVETKEIWSSHQFPGYLYSRTVTPRDGEIVIRLDKLKFGDVPASLFAIPADYPVRDLVPGATPAEQ
jgi:hypothetical protein